MMARVFLLSILLLAGCTSVSKKLSYQDQYAFQNGHVPRFAPLSRTEYFLVVLVNARHLDYSDGRKLLKTMAKHPRDGSKNGDVGHAWILVCGNLNGKRVCIEGGHSGEGGEAEPRYLEGIWNNIEFGCPSPTPAERSCPDFEPDPVKYLWEERRDGFFQKGSGGHMPTYAVKVNLTKEQFDSILKYINPKNYDFAHYSITGDQCSSFAATVAAIGGLKLESEVAVPIPKKLRIGRRCYRLWTDPLYSCLEISSPDILEKSMMEAVEEGRAEYALPWYLRHRVKRHSLPCRCKRAVKEFSKIPERSERAKLHFLL